MGALNIMGFGSIVYGSRERNKEDNSYITTKWFVLFYLPVIPMFSYRVILGNQSGVAGYARVEYQSVQEIELNKKQIINTYLLWYIPILIVVLSFLYIS